MRGGNKDSGHDTDHSITSYIYFIDVKTPRSGLVGETLVDAVPNLLVLGQNSDSSNTAPEKVCRLDLASLYKCSSLILTL